MKLTDYMPLVICSLFFIGKTFDYIMYMYFIFIYILVIEKLKMLKPIGITIKGLKMLQKMIKL